MLSYTAGELPGPGSSSLASLISTKDEQLCQKIFGSLIKKDFVINYNTQGTFQAKLNVTFVEA